MAVLEAMELCINASIPAEMQALFEEAELMCKKWEAERKVRKDDAVQKVQEEAAACEVEEVPQAEDEERVEVVNPPKEEAVPVHEEEEESREPTPTTKPAAKPAAPKRLEFQAMRATSMASPSVHGSVCSMEVVIPVKWKVSGSIPGQQVLTGLTALHTRQQQQ